MRPRPFLLALCAPVLATASARADAPPYKLFEDAALGTQLTDKPLLVDRGSVGPAIAACTKAFEPASGAVFFVELSKAGTITSLKVRGSGKPVIDTCLAGALGKLTVAGKLPGPVALAGRVDLKARASDAMVASARLSTTPVVLPAHDAPWQLTVHQLGYTSNRAADIAQALDGASEAIAACAPKRGASATAAEAIVWYDGKAIVRSGTPAYDDCVGKALDTIKLPAPDSALWMKLAIMKPSEPLAPRTDNPALSRDRALRDALTTAVRSRKEILRTCLDGTLNASLDKVTVGLAGGKARIARVDTGDLGANVCVKKKFGEVAIPNAGATDKLELEVALEPQ
ncbi:MAG TPA: hypothetical protein VFQ53_29855 [Kofleriaceae bacterium]|nr:hypothetical protein [Kofleriaceae bacterium]